MKFIYNLFVSLDQLLNTILLGHPDETLSSRLGRTIDKEKYIFVRVLRKLVDLLFFWEKDHCKNSIMPTETIHFRGYDREIWKWTKE